MEHARIFMTLFAFTLATLTLFFTARSAAAEEIVPSWATWKLELSGQNNAVQAVWYVTVGGDDGGGQPVALHTEPIELTCKPVGNAAVSGDTLVFNGGYFTCDFPDLIEEANKIIIARWGKEHVLKIGGECNCAPISLAHATADLQVKSEKSSTVFYHPNIRFGFSADKKGLHNHFYFGGRESHSSPIPVDQQAEYASHLVCEENSDTCFFEHYYAGSAAGSQKQLRYPAVFNTTPVTVFVGSSPGSQLPFLGSLAQLVVDPGCRVH